MASNAKLKEDIKELDGILGTDTDVEGLSNAELVEVLKGLRTIKAQQEPAAQEEQQEPAAQEEQQERQEPAAQEEPVKAGFFVKKGKSVTSKKGIIDQNEEVLPEYFPNGEDTLKELIEAGVVEIKGM